MHIFLGRSLNHHQFFCSVLVNLFCESHKKRFGNIFLSNFQTKKRKRNHIWYQFPRINQLLEIENKKIYQKTMFLRTIRCLDKSKVWEMMKLHKTKLSKPYTNRKSRVSLFCIKPLSTKFKAYLQRNIVK